MMLPVVLLIGCSQRTEVPPEEPLYQQYATRQDLKVGQVCGFRLNDTVRVDGSPVMRVIASHDKQTIGFYHIDNEAQYDALIDYQLENIKSKI